MLASLTMPVLNITKLYSYRISLHLCVYPQLSYIVNFRIAVGGITCAVCIPAGYLLSYWNRPFFPEFCSDAQLDDSVEYDTTVRIAGSWADVAHVFKTVATKYNWTHLVLVSDDETESYCWYGARPFSDVFGNDENYTFTWLRFASSPTNEEFDDILQQIRSRSRGCLLLLLVVALSRW